MLVILTLSVLFLGCAQDEDLMQKALQKYDNLKSYEANVKIQDFVRGQNFSVRLSFMKPDLTKVEYLEPEEISGGIYYYNGSTAWVVDTKKMQAVYGSKEEVSMPVYDYGEILKTLQSNYTFSKASDNVLSTELESGITLEIEFSDDMFPTSIGYYMNGTSLFRVLYDIREVELSKDTFEFNPAGYDVLKASDLTTEIETFNDTASASQYAGFEIPEPSYIPLENYSLQLRVIKSGFDTDVELLFYNESTGILVKVSTSGKLPKGENVTINGIDGVYADLQIYRILVFPLGDKTVTVMSDLDKEELLKVASSIIRS
jgi:outer membrane lipoprotein-sorting protein